jgi:hypothetical protein
LDEHDGSKREDGEAHSAADIESAISKLSKSDRVGKARELLNVVSGAAARATAPGAVGATTILGSSTLAGALGGISVASMRVGWIAGCVLAGGAVAYGVSEMIKSGRVNGQLRTEMVDRLTTRLQGLRHRLEAAAIETGKASGRLAPMLWAVVPCAI